MNIWTIYQHKFPNGKSYIGKTSQKPEDRWGNNGRNYNKLQPLMYNAIQKYGWDNIEHIILEEHLTAEEADIKEQEYIEKFHSYYLDEFGPGYNMTKGGGGHVKADAEKIEELYKQNQNTRIIAEQLGLNKRTVGRILRQKEYDLSKNGYKRINQFTLDGQYVATYNSEQEAANKTGIDNRLISRVVRGIKKSSGGFQWRSYNELDLNGIEPIYYKNGGSKNKKIAQYDMNNNLIKIYESVTAAANAMSRTRANIRAAAQGKTQSAAGYKWKFVDKD